VLEESSNSFNTYHIPRTILIIFYIISLKLYNSLMSKYNIQKAKNMTHMQK
jgi:hypothetical protein